MTAPTPLEIRAKNGNPARRPLPTPRTVGGRAQGAPPVPRHFTKAQAEAWREVIADLIVGDVFDKADRYVIEAFCVLLGRLRELRELINEREGLERYLAETVRGTWTANTLVTQERETAKEVRLMATELGLTAISRTRLGLRDPHRTGVAGINADLDGPSLQVLGD